jgi:hypothetical protein
MFPTRFPSLFPTVESARRPRPLPASADPWRVEWGVAPSPPPTSVESPRAAHLSRSRHCPGVGEQVGERSGRDRLGARRQVELGGRADGLGSTRVRGE